MRLWRRSKKSDHESYTPYEAYDERMARWLDEAGTPRHGTTARQRDIDWVTAWLSTPADEATQVLPLLTFRHQCR